MTTVAKQGLLVSIFDATRIIDGVSDARKLL
jgi:hypothetical protein